MQWRSSLNRAMTFAPCGKTVDDLRDTQSLLESEYGLFVEASHDAAGEDANHDGSSRDEVSVLDVPEVSVEEVLRFSEHGHYRIGGFRVESRLSSAPRTNLQMFVYLFFTSRTASHRCSNKMILLSL